MALGLLAVGPRRGRRAGLGPLPPGKRHALGLLNAHRRHSLHPADVPGRAARLQRARGWGISICCPRPRPHCCNASFLDRGRRGELPRHARGCLVRPPHPRSASWRQAPVCCRAACCDRDTGSDGCRSLSGRASGSPWHASLGPGRPRARACVHGDRNATPCHTHRDPVARHSDSRSSPLRPRVLRTGKPLAYRSLPRGRDFR